MSSGRNEALLWKKLRDKLKIVFPTSHFVRVENAVGKGTPDLSYCIPGNPPREGWLELKCITHWPRSDTVLIHHFTPEQKMWIRKRSLAGGNVWVLLKVEDEDQHLLFDSHFAYNSLGQSGRTSMEEESFFTFWGLTEENVSLLLRRL